MSDTFSLPDPENTYIVHFFLIIKYILFQKDYIAIFQKKKKSIASIGEDVEQLKLSNVTSKDINWFKHLEGYLAVSTKVKHKPQPLQFYSSAFTQEK